MQTTNLGNVAMQNSTHPHKKQPLNRNIYGSCGFGEVSVHQLLAVDPDEKVSLSNETLLYLASIVSPTYGHVTAKFWTYFVALSDLSKNAAALMAQTNVKRSGGLFVPTAFPYMPKNLLYCMCLIGAHMTVYKVTVDSDGTRHYTHPIAHQGNSSELGNIASFWNDLVTRSGGLFVSGVTAPWGSQSLAVDCRALVDFGFDGSTPPGSYITSMWLPVSNPEVFTISEVENSDGMAIVGNKGIDVAPVTVDGSDIFLERQFTYNGQTYKYAFAFRLHAFGSRLYKVLKGMELQDDFTSSAPVSLMPLFATYKAYFECFYPMLYVNYENTALADLMSLFDEYNVADFAFGMVTTYTSSTPDNYSRLSDMFQQFITEVGNMWVTSSQDFESAHTKTIGVSPKVDQGNPGFAASFASTPNNNVISNAPVGSAHVSIPNQNVESTGLAVTQHAFINNLFHGQLDSELLKKLYVWVNRNTIAGKRIEELLRSQGLGDWVDNQKPRFINYQEIDVDFSKVLANADTMSDNGKKGAMLGDRGGYAQAYKYGKTFSFTPSEHGFIITLMAVVPDAGLTNCENVAFSEIRKLDFYQPFIDGLGMEETKIKQIVGSMPICCDMANRRNVLEQGFGFIPQQTKFKVVQNILNGNFARHSRRDYFLTYNMDKLINVGDVVTRDIEKKSIDGQYSKEIQAFEAFPPSALPKAGVAWRYTTRYPWLGLFSRIFASKGDDIHRYRSAQIDVLAQIWEYCANEDDGFFYLSTIRGMKNTPKLPISDSFETREDGNDGKISKNVSKA